MPGTRKCDVCGNTQNVGVAASSLTAGSFAYCSECLLVNAEPYDIIVGLFIGDDVYNGLEGLLEGYESWVERSIYNSLERKGKSEAEFLTDVQIANAEFEAYLNGENFEDYIDEELEEEINIKFNSIENEEN